MLIVRLKQCDRALADGRLDEAFDLARQSDVRAHRRGQQLTQRLVRALIERGRHHLAQGALPAAAADADKAVYLGGYLAEAVQLREAVRNASHSVEKVRRQAGQALALAHRHADAGQLTIGQQVLDQSPVADSRLEDFRRDLTARQAGVDDALMKATQAFDAGEWESAVDLVNATGRFGTQDAGLLRLSNRIADHVAARIEPLIESGRLDIAATLLARIESLRTQTTATRQMRQSLSECNALATLIAEGRQQEANAALHLLMATWPKSAWINELAEQNRRAVQAQAAIRSSPLALLSPANKLAPATIIPPKMPIPSSPSHTLVLHVDAVGSFRILTSPKVSIGPLSSTRPLDLPLMIDPASPAITITRSDEDYFFSAARPVLINDTPRLSRLLNNRDRISLSARCRLTFRRPSAASGTAALDLSGARLPNAGIRTVILLDREIVIGPGPGAHIRADEMAAPVVLLLEADAWTCRSNSEIQIEGRPEGKIAALPVGTHISIGSLGFVISREKRT